MTLRIPDRRFLSTPSARRATIALCHFVFSLGISIHALREEGDFSDVVKQRVNFFISIHALREEGDAACSTSPKSRRRFLSTPSARRATRLLTKTSVFGTISIHALREEGDRKTFRTAGGAAGFLSTPSARRATSERDSGVHHRKHFYPRPPRGGRRSRAQGGQLEENFYPRPPRGGRPEKSEVKE